MTGEGLAQVRLVAEELGVLITVDLRGVAAPLDVDQEREHRKSLLELFTPDRRLKMMDRNNDYRRWRKFNYPAGR